MPADPSPVFTPQLGPGLLPTGFDWLDWQRFSLKDLKKRFPNGEFTEITAFVDEFPDDHNDNPRFFTAVVDPQHRLNRMELSYSYHPDRVPSPNVCEQMDARYRKAVVEVPQTVLDKMGPQEPGPVSTEWLWCAGVADGQVPIRIRCLEYDSSATLFYEVETASVEPCASAFGVKDPVPRL